MAVIHEPYMSGLTLPTDQYNVVGYHATKTESTIPDYLKALKKAIEEEEKTLQELPH